VSSALASFREDSAPSRDYKVAALLPAGRAALSVASEKVLQGYETFKWKIGVEPVEAEQAIFGELATRLPEGARLRLDANGGLSVECLESWLSFLQAHRGRVDYLEQPLAVGEEAVMARCSEASGIPIALDESLHGADGLRWLEARAWPGPLVVKPALAGDDRRLIERLRPVARQVVLSSVFETQVGLENALHLADQLPGLNRVIGFDTLDAFADSLCILHSTSTIRSAERGVFSPETLWQQLLHST
jgi:O-succinylbenzoate synthase